MVPDLGIQLCETAKDLWKVDFSSSIIDFVYNCISHIAFLNDFFMCGPLPFKVFHSSSTLLDCKSLKLSLLKTRSFQFQDVRTARWLLKERFKLGDVNQVGKYKARCRANIRRKVDEMHHQPVCHLMTACSSLHLIHDPGLHYRNRMKKHESLEIVFVFVFKLGGFA